MSAPVFISFHFRNDRQFARNIHSFFKPQGPCNGTPRFVEKDVSAEGSQAIDREIRRVMQGCVAAVFVTGDDTHNSPWINREVELARSMGLGIVALRAPGSTGGVAHELLVTNAAVVPWNSGELSRVLNPLVERPQIEP